MTAEEAQSILSKVHPEGVKIAVDAMRPHANSGGKRGYLRRLNHDLAPLMPHLNPDQLSMMTQALFILAKQ